MAVYADRVKETTTTTGTGTYSLDGAGVSFQTFVAGVGNGAVVSYVCEDGTNWEVGEGTVADGTPDTLTRSTIWASSNAGAAVVWSAGTKNIYLTIPAKRLNSQPVEVASSNVNHVTIQSANTGVGPAVIAKGSDSSIPLAFGAKGDSYFLFYNDIGTSLTAKRAASSDNQLDIQNNTGNTEIKVTSGSANVNILLTPKGTGQILVPDGAVGTPTIGFASDTDLGLYRSAANTLGVAASAVVFPVGSETVPSITFAGSTTTGIFGGDTNVNLAGAGKHMAGFYQRIPATSNTTLYFNADTGYTETYYVNSSNFATATINYQLVGGTSTGAWHAFQSYNGTTYRTMFEINHDAAVSGAQNYLAVYCTNSGGTPYIVPGGSDANINLALYGKGTGGLRLCGTATTVSGTGAISTSEIFTHSGSTAHTISTTGAVTFTGAVVQSTKGFAAAEYAGGSGAPGTITWSNGQNQVRTLTSSGTMTFASPTAGATYKLRIVQGGSGSYTITWPTIKWAGGAAPTLSTAVSAEDIVTLYYNGTSYYGQAATGFA